MLKLVKPALSPTAVCTPPWRKRLRLLVLTSLALAPLSDAWAQQRFGSAQSAASSLATAVEKGDETALRTILGPHGHRLISSGDAVADARNRASFNHAYAQGHEIVFNGAQEAQLLIGQQGWPLPIALVRLANGKWRFDPARGEVEILTRRMGANELAAIQTCLAVVEAEREFAARDADGNGLREYAARFTSTPGQRDGLYWPTEPQENLSPLGPMLAAAATEGYLGTGTGSSEPYQGYLYKILTQQGPDASGGAYSYLVNGQMIAGFALLAYPARYGASGIMSFVVSQDGTVYQKDLGRNTAAAAHQQDSFNPDATWRRVPGV